MIGGEHQLQPIGAEAALAGIDSRIIYEDMQAIMTSLKFRSSGAHGGERGQIAHEQFYARVV